MTNKEKFIRKNRRKYFSEKRLSLIYYVAREYVLKLGKEERKYTTLETGGEQIDKYYSLEHEINKYAQEYISNRKSSELYGYMKNKQKDIQYAKYYKYRRRLNFKKQDEDGALETFLQRYGTEEYEGKTINQYLNEFKHGKISQQELNNILTLFKKDNKKYKEQTRTKGHYK